MRTEFITTKDPRWMAFLENVRHDFYHLPSYLDFCARHEGGTAGAYYAQEDNIACLAPMLFRSLPEELGAPEDWMDAITPYGYSSPLICGAIDPAETSSSEVVGRMIDAFRAAAVEHGLVSAFFRLHPLLPLPVDELAKHGTLLQHHGAVVIDLTLPLEELEHQTRRGHMRDIRKLKEAGFTVKLDDWDRLDDFIRLYISTMARVEATDFYFFSNDYFHDLRATLGDDRLHLFTVQAPNSEEVVSASLFTMMNHDIVQGHLGATATEYLHLAPFKLAVDFIRRWAKEAGCQALNLGGGVGNHDDSLFRFKAGFSPLFKEFYTYRLVLDEARYAELNRLWEAKASVPMEEGSDFFPLYRRPLTPEH